MIRLGYPNCVSCHVSPQGGGLLNEYGRGVDEAQSLRAGEYKPVENRFTQFLRAGGRINQDFRNVTGEQVSSSTGQPWVGSLKSRFFYRNVTQLGKGFQVTAMAIGETDLSPRKALPYEGSVRVGRAYIGTALLDFKPSSNMQISAGRDQLPTGLNLPDQSIFIKSRNRFGYYDMPTQVKMFWWGKRYHVSPYAFAPSGEEHRLDRESGGGILAEYDLLGQGRTVVGVNLLRGTGNRLDRTVVAPYARLGFGSWGIFAEHDITRRAMDVGGTVRFGQHASYLQGFKAVREWFVVSAIAEQLWVERPYSEQWLSGKGEIAARLTSDMTIGFRAGLQRDVRNNRWAPVVSLQLALKTVY
jgi:hypothetical protein